MLFKLVTNTRSPSKAAVQGASIPLPVRVASTKALASGLYQKNPAENQAETAQALGHLADVLEDMKRYAEAEPLLRQTVAILEQIEPQPKNDIAKV